MKKISAKNPRISFLQKLENFSQQKIKNCGLQ